jgi:hypothetical protein
LRERQYRFTSQWTQMCGRPDGLETALRSIGRISTPDNLAQTYV